MVEHQQGEVTHLSLRATTSLSLSHSRQENETMKGEKKTWLHIIFLTDLFHQGAYPGYE